MYLFYFLIKTFFYFKNNYKTSKEMTKNTFIRKGSDKRHFTGLSQMLCAIVALPHSLSLS